MYRSLAWLAREGIATTSPFPERRDRERFWWDQITLDLHAKTVKPVRARVHDSSRDFRGIIAATHASRPLLKAQRNGELRTHALNLRGRLRQGVASEALFGECFALIVEAAHRTLQMEHYDEQLLGGYALLQGKLVEMATGEGKTLTASLPAAAAGLLRMPTHVVTVNDYLAARDAEALRPLYEFLGLSVGVIQEGMNPDERRAAYAADITYCTNKQVVFDYLKDQIAIDRRLSPVQRALSKLSATPHESKPLVMRGLHFGIVDEADSVLIDEARTPLILSRQQPDPAAEESRRIAFSLATKLAPNDDFEIRKRQRSVELKERGKRRLDIMITALARPDLRRRVLRTAVSQALTAIWIFKRNEHYVVREGKVEIVDEYTGRILADRSWENGLHQMAEIKEDCGQTPPRETQARITYQRFFRRYLLLAGMSGTAQEVAAEMSDVYGLEVIRMPLHKPSARIYLPSTLCSGRAEKWISVAQRVAEVLRSEQRPVLIGTRTIEDSLELSQKLHDKGISHALLNAVREADEAAIVANAGRAGQVTVATNMAGRGTDIKLAKDVVARGGLHVILTEYHDTQRIDRQLFGRCARQGDRGSCEAIVALGDPVFVRNAGFFARLLQVMSERRVLRVPLMLPLLRYFAQTAAERKDARMRRHTMHEDRRLDKFLGFAGRQR